MEDTKPMSVKSWMLTIFVLAIPLVNIIMYFYWALSGSGNVNRKNFCIASLIWAAIAIGVSLCIAVIAILIGSMSSSYSI